MLRASRDPLLLRSRPFLRGEETDDECMLPAFVMCVTSHKKASPTIQTPSSLMHAIKHNSTTFHIFQPCACCYHSELQATLTTSKSSSDNVVSFCLRTAPWDSASERRPRRADDMTQEVMVVENFKNKSEACGLVQTRIMLAADRTVACTERRPHMVSLPADDTPRLGFAAPGGAVAADDAVVMEHATDNTPFLALTKSLGAVGRLEGLVRGTSGPARGRKLPGQMGNDAVVSVHQAGVLDPLRVFAYVIAQRWSENRRPPTQFVAHQVDQPGEEESLEDAASGEDDTRM